MRVSSGFNYKIIDLNYIPQECAFELRDKCVCVSWSGMRNNVQTWHFLKRCLTLKYSYGTYRIRCNGLFLHLRAYLHQAKVEANVEKVK